VVRVFVTYTEEPDPARYAQHVELCRAAGATAFRHGKVLRTIHGEPQLAYYAEFEFPDMDTFKGVAGSDAFRATGEDAAAMGVPHAVYLTEVA
jgi:hypothetical protein